MALVFTENLIFLAWNIHKSKENKLNSPKEYFPYNLYALKQE